MAGYKTKRRRWDQFTLVRNCFDMVDNEYAKSYSKRGLMNILKIPEVSVEAVTQQMEQLQLR